MFINYFVTDGKMSNKINVRKPDYIGQSILWIFKFVELFFTYISGHIPK